jgi:soluble lytic murein transglycosylase-like protein
MGGETPSTGATTPIPSSYSSAAPAEIQAKAKEYAAKHGVPEAIAMRMLNAESGGNIRAVSSKGASGLLQLMPGTARGLGVTDIFDVDQNLNAGYKYVSQLATKYNGNWEYAVAAYNMGPNGFDKFMTGQRNLPRETNGYVKKVMGSCSFCT